MGNIIEGEKVPEVAGEGRMTENQEDTALVPYLLERQARDSQECLKRGNPMWDRDTPTSQARDGGALRTGEMAQTYLTTPEFTFST